MEYIDYGVCRLSVVPAWDKPAGVIQVIQVLFGEHYRVLEKSADKEWLKIQLAYDNVEAWISVNHHHSILPEFFEQIEASHFKIATDLVSTILYKKSPLPIVIGSIVPISSSELFKMDEQFAYNGEAKPLAQKREKEFLKMIAHRYLHATEVQGGKNPFGISAQGFVQMVCKICGSAMPWEIHRMETTGKEIKDFHSHEEGDIAFFTNNKTGAAHVGIVLNDERVIHCSGSVRIDHLIEDGILHADTKAYTYTLTQIRRPV
jgi:hypothetical protein